MAHVQWTTAPDTGFWRIGRSPDPIRFSPAPEPEALDSPTAGNRFDSPTRSYSVCYFATDPVVGYERYTSAGRLESATGTLGALKGGTVKVEVYNVIGANPTTVDLTTSTVTLPYQLG